MTGIPPRTSDATQWQAYIASAFSMAEMSRRADEAARAGVDFAALERAAFAASRRNEATTEFPEGE